VHGFLSLDQIRD